MKVSVLLIPYRIFIPQPCSKSSFFLRKMCILCDGYEFQIKYICRTEEFPFISITECLAGGGLLAESTKIKYPLLKLMRMRNRFPRLCFINSIFWLELPGEMVNSLSLSLSLSLWRKTKFSTGSLQIRVYSFILQKLALGKQGTQFTADIMWRNFFSHKQNELLIHSKETFILKLGWLGKRKKEATYSLHI